MGDEMSKPQIAAVDTNAYRHLTVKEVAERIRRNSPKMNRASLQAPCRCARMTETSEESKLDQVPEHLF